MKGSIAVLRSPPLLIIKAEDDYVEHLQLEGWLA